MVSRVDAPLALYRRYRPETFAEVIGHDHVTTPLRQALSADRAHHAYHATRADLLRRLGRRQESRWAYDRAIELAGNTAETAYLTRRRDQLA